MYTKTQHLNVLLLWGISIIATPYNVLGDPPVPLTLPLREYHPVTCDFTCYPNHNGIDYGNMPNQPSIVAAADGRVIRIINEYPDGWGWHDGKENCPRDQLSEWGGNRIQIEHANGVTTTYMHLKKDSFPQDVYEGASIKRGQIIARADNTGCSTGPHLHFGVRINGVPQDPYSNHYWGLIKSAGNPTVYWFQNNVLYPIDRPEILDSLMDPIWRWSYLVEYRSDDFVLPANPKQRGATATLGGKQYTIGPIFITKDSQSNGLLIRQRDKNEVYEVNNGGFRHIEFEECQQRNCWPDVIEVTESIISLFRVQIGAPLDKGYNLVIHMLLNLITLADMSGNCTFPEYPYVKHYDASMTAPEWVTSLEPFKIYWVKAAGPCTARVSGILQGGFVLVFNKGPGWYGITSRKSWNEMKGSCSLASGQTSLWSRVGDLGWFQYDVNIRMNGFTGLALKVSANCESAGILSRHTVSLQRENSTGYWGSYKQIPAPLLAPLSTLPENQEIALHVKSILAAPNPVKRGDQIRFSIEGVGVQSTRIEVFDLLGRRLFDSGFINGSIVLWSLQDNNTKSISNGVYLYVASVRGFLGEIRRIGIKKMVVLK